ncbi:MAG: PAS domain S-box protein, partial [Promethearchaeota archaeon]
TSKQKSLISSKINNLGLSEEIFRTLVEESSLGIIILQNGYVKYTNNALSDISGYSLNELRNWSQNEFMEKIHPEDLPIVVENLNRKLIDEKSISSHYTIRIITKSGMIKWIDLHSKMLNYKSLPSIFATFIDITEKKEAELKIKVAAEKIRKSEEKYRDLYEEAPNAYFSVNRDGLIVGCNAAAEKLLRYSKEELLNKKFFELYYDSEHGTQKAKKLFQKFLNGETSQDEELQMMRKNGEPVWISLSVKPIIDKDGNVVESRSMVIDITERKIAENTLKISEQKYREAYDRANFYKDLFAHDINNILQIVNSSAELTILNLRGNVESKEIESIANIIKRQIQRGSKLVSNVQTLSEFEESQISINPIDVREQLENSIEFIKKSYSERLLNIKIKQFCDEIIVNANEYLQEVFENVLINAIKYNKNPSVEINIKISTQNYDKKDYYKLEFIDNGIGVADERKKLIFERGKRELKGTKGMGLGLSLVKKIIESYKGKIWVEDKVKGDYTQGSKFIILLPILN